MNILEIINRLRKISIDDIIRNYKKLLISSVIIVLIVLAINAIFKSLQTSDITTDQTEVTNKEYLERYEEETENSIYKTEAFDTEITEQEKNDFNNYNLLELSEVSVNNDIAKVTIKNKSDETMTNIILTLVNEEKEEVLKLETNSDLKLKSNKSITLEGLSFQDKIEISKYSFSLKDEHITIDLINKYASTSSNYEESSDYHDDHEH